MEPIGKGRDADAFALDADRVLLRYRSHPPPSFLAELASYLRDHDYPAPAVFEVDGNDVVFERADGPTMLDALTRRPWTWARHAATLADLHRRLHEIHAPEFLPRVDDGDRVLHLDLHPANVIVTPNGPAVIDWVNAGRGRGATDVASTWLLMRVARPPREPLVRAATTVLRRLFVRAFIRHFDEDEVRGRLARAAELRRLDPNLSARERAAMQRLAKS